MSYEKHDFEDGQVLHAEQLNDMDNAIKELADGGGSGGGLQLEQIGEAKTLSWFGSHGSIRIEYYKLGDNMGVIRMNGSGMPYTAPSSKTEIEIDTTPFRAIKSDNVSDMILPVMISFNGAMLKTTSLIAIEESTGKMKLVGLPTEEFNSFMACGIIPARTVNT